MKKKNGLESQIFNYKTVRILMQGFGSFMIAVGSMYAYFIIEQLGFAGIENELFAFIASILAIPAGIFVAITGKKLKAPIIKDDPEAN